MSLTHQVAKNTLVQLVNKLLAIAVGLLTIGLMTRYLGVAGYGQFTTVWAYLQLFGLLTDFGLYLVVAREIAKPNVDQEKILSNSLGLRLSLNALFLLSAPLISLFFPYPPLVKLAIAVASFFFFFQSTTNLFTGLFQLRFQMIRFAWADMAGRIVLLALIALTAQVNGGLLWVMLAFGLSASVSTVFTVWQAKKLQPFTLRFDWDIWKYLARESWPLAVSIGFILIYFKGDTLLLSLFRDETAVGLYGAPYKILEVLVTVPAAFAGLLLPVLSNHYSAGRLDDFKRVLQKGTDFLAVLAIPLVFGVPFVAEKIMTVVAGQEFVKSGPLLSILTVATAVIFLSNILQFAIIASGEQRRLTKYFALAAVIALIAYLITIPPYGYWGAAWTTVAVEFLILLAYFIILKRLVNWQWNLGVAKKSLLAGLVMAALLYFTQDLIKWWGLIILGAVVYGAMLLLTKAVTKETIQKALGTVSQA